MPAIYMLRSPTGKAYIGQTKNCPRLRFSQHKTAWRRWVKDGRKRSGYQAKLYYAFDAHLPETWELIVLYESDEASTLNEMERLLIAEHGTVDGGYNLLVGGGGWTGRQLSEEHRRKQSEARKAWYQTPEGIEWRRKLAEKKDHLKRMAENSKGTLGYKHTDEWKAGNSARMKARWANGGHRHK